jgi:hypothetical protein
VERLPGPLNGPGKKSTLIRGGRPMSLAASMHSWCDTYKNDCKDRSANIDGVIKQTDDLVRNYYDNRLRMGSEMKKQLKLKYLENEKKVSGILHEYMKDRSGAAGALSNMRG